MPLSWPSIRSIARCVLPVLVGPSTAVTPRARSCGGGERRKFIKEMASCGREAGRFQSTLPRRTGPERSRPESATRVESGFVPDLTYGEWPPGPPAWQSPLLIMAGRRPPPPEAGAEPLVARLPRLAEYVQGIDAGCRAA